MKYSIAHIARILLRELIPGRDVQGAAGAPGVARSEGSVATPGASRAARSEATIEHLLVDSRRLIFPDTTLFFALRGPGRDGHRFIGDLYKRGVRNFVVHEVPRGGDGGGGPVSDDFAEANFIVVPDTLAALQWLAASHRRQFDLPVIGITGSNGKTIVKEWLNQLLEEDYQIARSPKSYNSQTGVPLSVWQLNSSHQLGIFEAGISLPDEMQRLEGIIRPTIGLFTNIGEAHSEGFESLLQKASEKALLFAHADLLIYCKDHEVVAQALALPAYAGKTHFTWGRHPDATLVIRAVEKKDGFTTIGAVYGGKTAHVGREYAFAIPFVDEASIENALHCICVLLHFGVGPEKIARKLENLSPITMRLELKSGVNHCSIINDSYSADLSSLTIALDFLAQQQQHPRRSVILSDILESGRGERELYQAVAMALRQKKIDRLVAIGAKIGAHAAEIGEVFAGEAAFYATVDEFKRDIHRLHFRDETILIKGARVFEFEQIDHLLSGQIHQTVLEINLNAMANNLRQYRQLIQPTTKVMAMVKAFGYGSGSYEIANLLQFHGVDYLGVAYADEGVALRKAGIRMPIMVMNAEESGFDALVQYNLEPVLYSFHLLQALDGWLKRQGVLRLPVHVELETGMNRLGFSLARLGELEAALGSAHITVQSVFSHLAASEEAAQDEFTLLQAALYLDAARSLRSALGYPFLQHIANTAAISRHPQLQLDMVRLGIGLYGVDSAAADHPLIELQEVSTLRSTIAQIKRLRDGETIGYNRRGIAAAGEIIATVRIGYADGYPRSLGNGAGKMWIRGRLAPVVGSVCMDMTMIDITGIEGVQAGDEVMVFGKQLPVSKLAEWAGTIPYEILTGVSQRVKRVYFEE